MNILFVESGSGYGGSARSMFLFLKYLDKKRFNPIVFYYNLGPNIRNIKDLGIEIYKFHFFNLIKFFLRQKIDVLYVNNEIYSHLFTIIFAKFLGIPAICHVRGIRKLTRREKLFANWVKLYISVSEACRENLILNGISADKIKVVYNGVEVFQNNNNKQNEPRNFFNIGVVSRIVPGKGHDVVLESLERLIEKYSNIRISFFGDDPYNGKPTLLRIKSLAKMKSLERYVDFCGWSNDINEIYSNLDIVVCPSELEESFGRNVAEAMMCGKPVIAAEVGAHKELVKDNITGLFFKPKDPADLFNKLCFLIENKDIYNRIAKEARDYAYKKFDILNNVKLIEGILTDGKN